MVSWLNSNQGSVMAILTAVYVITNAVIATIMLRANSISSRNLTQALMLEKQRSRPYLVFDLEVRHRCFLAVLRNLGKTAALNVRVSISPQLKSKISGEEWPTSLTSNEISFMPPNKEIIDFILPTIDFCNLYPNLKFNGELVYFDTEGSIYKESFELDLNYRKTLLQIPDEEDRILNELSKISESIEGLERRAKEVHGKDAQN